MAFFRCPLCNTLIKGVPDRVRLTLHCDNAPVRMLATKDYLIYKDATTNEKYKLVRGYFSKASTFGEFTTVTSHT